MTSAEFIHALEQMDAASLALGAGLAGIVLTLMAVGGIVWYFLSAIGHYAMFKKAGRRGWLAFIPVVKDFVCFDVAWSRKNFWIYLAAYIVFFLTSPSEAFVMSLICIIVSILLVVLDVKLCLRMARCFGKSGGWGVLLFFFPFVTSLILGFGSAQYIAPLEEPAE